MPSHRIHRSFLCAALLAAGCSSSPVAPSPYRITRTTTDQTLLGAKHRGAVGAVVIWDEANATADLDELVRQVKIVARHRATPRQREVAHQRAAAAVRHQPPVPRHAQKHKAVRYLAVETERNSQSQGRKSVMIWDTTSSSLVGDEVYDIAASPATGSRCIFDTYCVNYVGDGL